MQTQAQADNASHRGSPSDARTTSSVSVVIPCYNYGHYLRAAVASVLDEQPGVDVAVLIIDDASTDDSADVAQDIAASDERVSVEVHRSNRGHIATYNEGLLAWASGDYCVLMSADDQLTPGALARAATLLDTYPDVGFAYGSVVWFNDGDALPPARTVEKGWSVWEGGEWLLRRCRRATTGVISPEVVVRTSLQHQVGGYDSRLTHVGDQDMWLRLASHGDVGYLKGVDQAYYRRHGQNMSRTYPSLVTLRQLRIAFDSLVEVHGERLRDVDRLAGAARRRLAWEAVFTAVRAYDKGVVETTPVDELLEFALECWPQTEKLWVYRSLLFRQAVGPRAMPFLQPLLLPAAAARRADAWWVNRSWSLHG
jgi:glycosyltransferase involved in cell wall biosynthesis